MRWVKLLSILTDGCERSEARIMLSMLWILFSVLVLVTKIKVCSGWCGVGHTATWLQQHCNTLHWAHCPAAAAVEQETLHQRYYTLDVKTILFNLI